MRVHTSFSAIFGKDNTVVFQFNQCISKKWYERRLDAMLTAVGEDPTLYSVHSLRAGGATELFLSGVIPVQIYGRRKFESALIYFRDDPYAAVKAFETGVFSCIGGNETVRFNVRTHISLPVYAGIHPRLSGLI